MTEESRTQRLRDVFKWLGMRFWAVDFEAAYTDPDAAKNCTDRQPVPHDDPTASAFGSEAGGGYHYPLFDIDFPISVMKSSTEGHYHLVLHRRVSWDRYRQLMYLMAEMGLLETGYVMMAEERGQAFLRLPGVSKYDSPAPTVLPEQPTEAPF